MTQKLTSVLALTMSVTLFANPIDANAAIALTVGKEPSGGDDVMYSVAWHQDWYKASKYGIQLLEDHREANDLNYSIAVRSYKNAAAVDITGGGLARGVYVVVQWKGRNETRFGLGAHGSSYEEAKRRAVNMLESNSYGRFKRDRHMDEVRVVQQKRFPR